jgi:hypothetical protein
VRIPLTADESVSLFVIFKLAASEADSETLNAFLKEIILNVEVAITDAPKQPDPSGKREKFEGAVVYSTTIPESSELLKEEIDGQWLVVWDVSVPISLLILSALLIN